MPYHASAMVQVRPVDATNTAFMILFFSLVGNMSGLQFRDVAVVNGARRHRHRRHHCRLIVFSSPRHVVLIWQAAPSSAGSPSR